jgi:hypothetical protein
MLETRKPTNYVGKNHETSGRDVLAILKTVNLPEVTLGKELAGRLKTLKPDGWYPISDLVEMLERMDQKLGSYHLKQVGWTIIQSVPAGMMEQYKNARTLLSKFNEIYHFNNRGEGIGGWKVTEFSARRAELDKYTIHHCVMEEGIIEEALRKVGVTAKVTQSACFRKGAPHCHYVLEPRTVDERWGA